MLAYLVPTGHFSLSTSKYLCQVVDPYVIGDRGKGDLPETSLTLLQRARARNPQAWDDLVDQYAPTLYQWCRTDGVAAEDAKELTQEVLLTVFEKLESFSKKRKGGSFRRWLRRITRNRVIDFWRHLSRRPRAAGGGTSHNWRIIQLVSNSDREATDPQDVRLSMLPEIIQKVRQRCGNRTWAIFSYCVTDGFSAKDAAREFDVSIGYVHQVRGRVLRRFRQEFQNEFNPGDRSRKP